MKENSAKKNRFLTILMLVLLFAAYWVFCRVEVNAASSVIYVAETVLFFLVYSLCLFNIPLIIPLVLMIAGCVGMCFVYADRVGVYDGEYLIPLSYLFVFLFFIEQLSFARGKGNSVPVMILTYASRISPFAFLGVTVYYFDDRFKSYYLYIYILVLSAIIGIVYLVFALLKKNETKSKKKKRKQASDDTVQMRISFALAAVPILTAPVYLVLNRISVECLLYTVPMLWILNLVLLYGQGHPLVRLFFGKKELVSQKTEGGA
jgi:flagellar basal body-associated protein FliL